MLPFYVISLAVIAASLALWGAAIFSSVSLYLAQYTEARYAFYLDSGNVFYGTVRGVSPFSIKLSDAYSFQTVAVGETSTNNLTAQAENPFTKPENWLVINRRRILFYEKIGEEASVLRVIYPQP